MQYYSSGMVEGPQKDLEARVPRTGGRTGNEIILPKQAMCKTAGVYPTPYVSQRHDQTTKNKWMTWRGCFARKHTAR
jgi:hypothetical protein